jgi:septal ring factor EnvC (AmiA/AmiB activator)
MFSEFSLTTKLIIAASIVGLAILGFNWAVGHYEALVAKANRVDQLQQDLADQNSRFTKLQGLLATANDLLEKEKENVKKLAKQLDEVKRRLAKARQDLEAAKYLDTPVPSTVTSILCDTVRGYEGSAHCPTAPGTPSTGNSAPEVREK